MADWSKDGMFTRAIENPASPSGLSQTASRLQADQAQYDAGRSPLAPWMPQESMLETAKSWYTGANSKGTENGWDTDFYRNTWAQIDAWQNRAMQAEKGSVFYDWLDPAKNPQATGVAIWEDDSKDIRFGDVFNAGKKVGNLYEDYDEATADVMIGEFLFDNDTKARMFRDPNRASVYREAVEARKVEETDRALYQKSAEEFDRQVRDREVALREGLGNDAIIGGTVAAGAALGAGVGGTIGSAFFGIGAIPGAVAGGVIGGGLSLIGGLLNQDQMVEQAARSLEVVDRANQRFDPLRAGTIALGELGGFGMRMISPASNIVQGLADWKYGKVGDMEAEFYSVDEDGERKASNWFKGFDIAATLADGILQFSSPVGLGLYMGSMGASVAGGVGEISTGTVWNDSRGEFDKLENWQEWVGAVGSTSIDAAQMGVAGALAKASASARAAFGSPAPVAGRSQTLSGIRFKFDDAGEVVSSRATFELIAPSEFLRWVPTGFNARRLARMDGGAMTRDHLYRAAWQSTQRGSRFTDAILNGYLEGGEELVQAVLDPMATGDRADLETIVMSTLYGAAGGMGMGLGQINARPNSRKAMESRALANYIMRSGVEPTEEEWKGIVSSMSDSELQNLAISSPKEAAEINDLLATMSRMAQMDTSHDSVIGLAAAVDDRMSSWEKAYKKAQEEGNGSLVLMGMTADFVVTPEGVIGQSKYSTNSAVFSAWEAVNQVRANAEGAAAAYRRFSADLERLVAERATATDPDQQKMLDAKLADMQFKKDDAKALSAVANKVSELFLGLYAEYSDVTDPVEASRRIEEMNLLLQQGFAGKWINPDSGQLADDETQRHIRRAIEFKMARHPEIDSGSFALLMPQIDVELSRLGTANGTVYVHQSTLKAPGGDHDGDTVVPQSAVWLDDADLQALRRGRKQYVRDLGGGRVELVMDAPEVDHAYITNFATAYRDPQSQRAQMVVAELDGLLLALRSRYAESLGGPLPDAKLDAVLAEFKSEVLKGNVKIRQKFMNDLFSINAEGLLMMADDTNIPEALFINGRISQSWDRLQQELAHVTANEQTGLPKSQQSSRVAAETAYRTGIAQKNAATAAYQLSLLGTEPVRTTQVLHYSTLFRSATEVPGLAEGGFITPEHMELVELFRQLGRGETRTDLEKITGRTAIEDRVWMWLSKIVEQAKPETTRITPEVMLLMANMSVPNIEVTGPNNYSVKTGDITLLQLLLRRSLEIEETLHQGADPDSDIMRKIKKMKRLTDRDPDRSKHSYTASKAVLEVFGNRQLYTLVGEDSMYIGPQMTLNQLLKQLAGLHKQERSAQLEVLRRAPAYIKDTSSTFKDPPWPSSVLTDQKINAFSMLVDAVSVDSWTRMKDLRDRNETVHANLRRGLAGLKEIRTAHRARHSDRLKGADEVTVLRDMLNTRPDVVTLIASLIPDASRLGVYEVTQDGQVFVANWVEQFLVNDDFEKAIVTYYVQTKLTEYMLLGSNISVDGKVKDEEKPEGKVRKTQLKSRFLEVLHHVATQPDGIQLSRFLRAAMNAPTLDTLFETINISEPDWRNRQEELVPWFDDVAEFNPNPQDTWNAALPGAAQRDKLRDWGTRMSVLGSVAVQDRVNHEHNQGLISAMRTWRETGEVSKDAPVYFGLLKKALQNRRRFPDANGQAVRDQLMELLQIGLPMMQDKGKADDMAGPFGEPLITMNSWGWSDPLRQELASITAEDIDDIMTNLTKLVEGPVRIQDTAGRSIVLDFSNEDKVLEMLANPLTEGLAMAVITPVVRDVNAMNVVQHYADTDSAGSLSSLLLEQNFAHLFDEMATSSDRVKQAHRYIGTIESYVRNSTLDAPDDIRDKAFFPIQNMLNDFLVAYAHSEAVNQMDPRHLRDTLVVEVADAIKAIAALESADLRKEVRDSIAKVLQERIGNDSTLESLLANSPEGKVMENEIRAWNMERIDAHLTSLTDQIEAAQEAGDTARVAELEQAFDEYVAQSKMGSSSLNLSVQERLDVDSVLKSFALTGDPVEDAKIQLHILDYLGKHNRITQFQNKKTLDLYHAARRRIYLDPLGAHEPPLTDADWAELGTWASAVFISDYTSRSSSEVHTIPIILGSEGESMRRYFDTSWSYLIDNLFDDRVLEAASILAQSALADETTTSPEVAKRLEDGLLHPERLGTWTDRVPMESMKARTVLRNAAVKAAIAQEGDDPKALADFVGSGQVSWRVPEDDHFTVATLNGTAGDSVVDLLDSPLALVKLHNHFVRRITLTSTDPNVQLPPEATELLSRVGLTNSTHKSVEDGPLKVLDLEVLDRVLNDIQQLNGLTTFQLDIEYVDVNKLPASIEWANNIYFDGVGREVSGGAGLGAIATLFFGLGGLSKVGQQNPLDAATKEGAQFRAHVRTTLDDTLILEGEGDTIAQKLAAKATHLLTRMYPTGALMLSDLPSLYKLVKMRHVVVGTNPANGEREVWWAEKAISFEENGQPIPLDNIQLVPLSESVAQSLRGGAGHEGVRGTAASLQRPVLNLQDMSPLPSLDNARLAQLGLEDLGLAGDVANSALVQVSSLAPASFHKGKGKRIESHWKQRLISWMAQQSGVITARMDRRQTGEGTFDIARIRRTNSGILAKLLVPESMSDVLHRVGVPQAGLMDLGAVDISLRLASQIQKVLSNENLMIWVHEQEQSGQLDQGILGRADIDNNFQQMGNRGPTYGDVVVVNLSSIWRATGASPNRNKDALKLAQKVITKYAERGLTVVLQAENGEQELRNAVGEWLRRGSLGYDRIQRSSHFYSPITQNSDWNQNQKALDSSLTVTQVFGTKGLDLRFISDRFSTGLAEATEYFDPDHAQGFNRITHTLLPFNMVSTGGPSSRQTLAFNTPVPGPYGLTSQDAVASTLLELMKTPEGMKFLADKLGKDKPNMRLFRRNKNGTNDPGVLSRDDALLELKAVLEAGKYPLDEGQRLMTGSVVPMVSGDGSIYLARVGFKPPTQESMTEQRAAELDGKAYKIFGASNDLDKDQTVPPPFVVDGTRQDHKGLSVRGHYEQGTMAKMVSEGIGLKAGLALFPDSWKLPKVAMGLRGRPGIRVTRVMSETSVIGKGATSGIIDNFRDAFALTGISFKDDLVDFFFGKDPNRSKEDFDVKWNAVLTLMKQWEQQTPIYSATELQRAMDLDLAFSAINQQFNALASSVIADWKPVDISVDPDVQQDPLTRLVGLIFTTLSAPGVKVGHVVETPGLMTVSAHDGRSKVMRMPALLTDALNDPRHPELRNMLFDRINENMPVDDQGRRIYEFAKDFTFRMRMSEGGRDTIREGQLQIHMPIAADENALGLTQAALTANSPISPHVARVVNSAIGGEEIARVAPNDAAITLAALFGDNNIERFREGTAGEYWNALSRVKNNIKWQPWERLFPMEALYYGEGDAWVRQYSTTIDKSEWSREERAKANRLADELLGRLNLTKYGESERDEVDYLVRQFFGRPGPGREQEDYYEAITPAVYFEGLEFMKKNVKEFMHPLHGAAVPLEHHVFWNKVYQANSTLPKADRWAPLASEKGKRKAETWGDWVAALHSQMRNSNEAFHSMFRTPLDGFYHTYTGTTVDYTTAGLSTDELRAAKLMDPETNKLFLSIDPGEDALLRDPILLDTMLNTYDALVGETPVTNPKDARETATASLKDQIDAQRRWLEGERIAPQKKVSFKDYAKEGVAYQESVRVTNNFSRNIVNASITMRLFNPALYFSAMVEVPFRSALEHTTNILMGEHIGFGGEAIAKLGQKMGIQPMYSAEEIAALNKLVQSMGDSNKFLGEVYRELSYQTVVAGGRGKVGEFLEWTATSTARAVSDPRWGMRADSVAQRYINGALEYLAMTDSKITVAQFVQEMEEDPLWLKKRSPGTGFSAHTAGLNLVGQGRGTKATVLGKAIMRPIDSMAASSSGAVNTAGHLLKLPFMFTRFNANMLLTLSGMGSVDQMLAMMLDGRKKPGLMKKLSARARLDTYDEADADMWDYSDVIESMDLSRAFVRGAVTHTGLMLTALVASQLAVGGDDEEARRRARLAKYLNTPNYYDPRDASNDFRWTEAIFLDNVPVLNTFFKNETGHSVITPHWVFRQFTSPILGMMRFLETGDAREIAHGFWDAASAIPTSVTRLWSEADLTARLLNEAAKEHEGTTPEAQAAYNRYIVNLVGIYEKALLENSFVNSLRIAKDEYDRNPWAIPATNETGDLLREPGTGQPVATDALKGWQTEDGESNRIGYMNRSGWDAILHQYAENNGTAAMLLSIVPWLQGRDSTYLRENMVTKKQRVQIGDTDPAVVKKLIGSAFTGQGGADFLTKEELIRLLKAKSEAANIYWNQADIEAEADAYYDAYANNPLSVFDNDGKERVTIEGAKGIFKSLRDGVFGFDHPALAGISISQEMRDQLAEEWTDELMREGIEMGLSHESAAYRMRRIWFGDDMTGQIGIRELLYSKQISDKPYIEYDQLNVTYTLGPDGRPWATPFPRTTVLQALGLPVPARMRAPANENLTFDERGNVIDKLAGINTGLAALAPRPVNVQIEANDEIVEKAAAKTYTPSNTPYGYRRWPSRGYSRGGYSGGSSYFPNFIRMNSLPYGNGARMNTIPAINTNTPYIRRANVRRERFSSERGRLKQWQ